jgi:hypothetical protein
VTAIGLTGDDLTVADTKSNSGVRPQKRAALGV